MLRHCEEGRASLAVQILQKLVHVQDQRLLFRHRRLIAVEAVDHDRLRVMFFHAMANPFGQFARRQLRRVDLLDEKVARWRWSRGYAENVAWATVLAVTHEQAKNRIYNVAEPEGLSYLEWTQRVTHAAGWKGRIVVVPPGRLEPGGGHFEHHWVVDTTRIRAELGYMEVVPQEEALRRTVEWQRSNPPEKYDPKEFDYATEDAVLAELEKEVGY